MCLKRDTHVWAAGPSSAGSLLSKVGDAVTQPLKGVKEESRASGGSAPGKLHPPTPPRNSSPSGHPVRSDGTAALPVAFHLFPVHPLPTLRCVSDTSTRLCGSPGQTHHWAWHRGGGSLPTLVLEWAGPSGASNTYQRPAPTASFCTLNCPLPSP